MAVSEVSLTRAQVEEITGPDQRKIDAIENTVFSSLAQNNAVSGVNPLGDTLSSDWWVSRWNDGRIVMRTRMTTTSAVIDTFNLPYPLLTELLAYTTVQGTAYDSTAGDITIKCDNLTSSTVDIGATVNGVLTEVTISITIEGRWK